MSGNTCGCRVSWTYHWAVTVPRINTRGERERERPCIVTMEPHTIITAVGAVYGCKAKAGLKRSPRGLHTNTIAITAEIESGSSLKMTWFYFTAVQFPQARHHSKRRRRWVSIKGSTLNWSRDFKCSLARHLCMVREVIGARNEGGYLCLDEGL
ncbi:uncharacterized protein TNCV_63881 [Trichonephila clavipes]|nr:uncharacterized protein TNCV_63881 [Trichonephila clavipes]